MGGTLLLKQTVRDVPLEGKTVLVRADYNVPLEDDGSIADDFRIRSSLATIRYLHTRGCKVVIISHLGRPDGKRTQRDSLAPVAERLSELLENKVLFIDECVGDQVRVTIKRAPKNAVILLENVRFHTEEEANDEAFAAKLASDSGARYFVQDGFGVVHRAHASTAAITLKLPSVAGLLLEKEYETIKGAMKRPEHPFVAVLGGAKVSDKIEMIEALEPIADTILIGGAMANTFLASAGVDMGKSKQETDKKSEVKTIYDIATKKVGMGNETHFIRLPQDFAVASGPDYDHNRTVVSFNKVPRDKMALDIGDQTIEAFVDVIKSAKTVIWNGTLGLAEHPQFAHGSARVALALATHPHITSIIGGGDTADFVLHWDAKNGGSFSHVSTGGGASLELMAGKVLPGIDSLLDAPR